MLKALIAQQGKENFPIKRL